MGKFEGLADNEWAIVEPLIPYPWSATKHGQRPMHPRKILNTLIWVLTTGARWCDVPVGQQWASRACAHKYLGLWKDNGVFERTLAALQEICIDGKIIDLTRLSVDGFFSGGKGGGEAVDHGYKGKGVTTHLLVDAFGQPLRVTSRGASGEERRQVAPLLAKISGWLKPLISQGITPILEADKGYDAEWLRLELLAQKIFPYIPYRQFGEPQEGKPIRVLEKYRWKVERGISWLQRKYRRVVVRWERRMKYWEGFLGLGILLYWVRQLVVCGFC